MIRWFSCLDFYWCKVGRLAVDLPVVLGLIDDRFVWVLGYLGSGFSLLRFDALRCWC